MQVWDSTNSLVEKVVGLTGFVIIHVFIASFSPAQGERNQMVSTKFTRPVNAMPMSSGHCRPRRRERFFHCQMIDQIITGLTDVLAG